MEQAHQIVLGSAFFHGAHNQLIVVAGLVCIGIDGGQLMLTGRALVVLGFGEDAQPPELLIQILHELRNPGTDGRKIVVIQLLTLGSRRAKQSPAGQAQILPLGVQILGKQKILLLSPHAGDNSLGFVVAKQPQDADCLPGYLLQRTQQRRFLIERVSGVGEEHSRDVQTSVFDKCAGCWIPGGVTTGFKGCPQSTGGERTGIRFTPDQLFSGKLHNHPAVTGGRNEGIVFFRSNARHGLEPVGIVGRTLLKSPDFHGFRDFIGHVQRKCRSGLDAALPSLVDMGGQALLHYRLVEHITAEKLRDIQNLGHISDTFLSNHFRGKYHPQ